MEKFSKVGFDLKCGEKTAPNEIEEAKRTLLSIKVMDWLCCHLSRWHVWWKEKFDGLQCFPEVTNQLIVGSLRSGVDEHTTGIVIWRYLKLQWQNSFDYTDYRVTDESATIFRGRPWDSPLTFGPVRPSETLHV